MAQGKVFISYRREDAAGFSHAIYDRLADHISKDRIFMDVADIAAGEDFAVALKRAVTKCDVLIALIGKRWEGSTQNVDSRIDDANDWVRIEIATALERGIKVIPVLLDNAHLPKGDALPSELQALPRLNALEMRNTRMDADIADLVSTVMRGLGETWPPVEPGSRIYSILTSTYAFFTGSVLLILILGSMLTNEVLFKSYLAFGMCMCTTIVLLRLPIHAYIQSLSRYSALRIGAAMHAIASAALTVVISGSDGIGPFILGGVVPAALLYLGSNAMQLKRRS